jgi:hypothetical protein
MQFLVADWAGTGGPDCGGQEVTGEVWIGRLGSVLAVYWQAVPVPHPEDDPGPVGPPRLFRRAGMVVQHGWTLQTMRLIRVSDLPPSMAIPDLDAAFAHGPWRHALIVAAMWAVTGQLYGPLRRTVIRVREHRWREPIDGTVA